MKIDFRKTEVNIAKLFYRYTWVFVLFITLLALIIRLWRVSVIKEEIFDEVYFVNFAKNYLNHKEFFDIHPPLGKLIIAVGLKIFGQGQIGWRIMEVIFGTLLIPLGYLTGRELLNQDVNKSKLFGFFTCLILALDGMLLVYSRVGLMDIFMVFFILAGFYSFLKFARKYQLNYLILSGIFLALASSVKYIAGLMIFIYIAIAIVKKIKFKKYIIAYLFFLGIIPALIYLSFFLFNYHLDREFLKKVIEWHSQSLNYNINLKDTHPYGSKWWTWYLLLRPIWLYFKDYNGRYVGVVGLGNPILWWSSLLVVPWLVWSTIKKDKIALIILLSFLIMWLPWSIFNRVLFYYHAMSSFIFIALGIAYALTLMAYDKVGRLTVLIYFAIVVFLFFRVMSQ